MSPGLSASSRVLKDPDRQSTLAKSPKNKELRRWHAMCSPECIVQLGKTRMNHVLTSLQQQVLNYLRDNSTAAETAEGVNRMWLKRSRTTQSIGEMEQALEGLVVFDLIERHILPGGTRVYRAYKGAASK